MLNPSAAVALPPNYPAQDYGRLFDHTRKAGVGVIGIRVPRRYRRIPSALYHTKIMGAPTLGPSGEKFGKSKRAFSMCRHAVAVIIVFRVIDQDRKMSHVLIPFGSVKGHKTGLLDAIGRAGFPVPLQETDRDNLFQRLSAAPPNNQLRHLIRVTGSLVPQDGPVAGSLPRGKSTHLAVTT